MTVYRSLEAVWTRRLAFRRFGLLSGIAFCAAPVFALTSRTPADAGDVVAVASQSLLYALVIGVPLSAMEAADFMRKARGRTRSLPFTALFLAKTLVYAAWITVGAAIAGAFTHSHDETPWEDLLLHKGTLVAAASTAFIINVFLAASRLIGWKSLFSVISGRYHTPKTEDRLFAFVDVKGATAAAEQLGDLRFQTFLADLFRIIELTALEAGGEVHDYIGDQVMIMWSVGPGDKARPLHWVARLNRELAASRAGFEATYGLAPEIRIGMHLGPVIIGEVGLFRTKLTCLGDAVNTAARVEELAQAYSAGALVTEAVLDRFRIPRDALRASPLGRQALRGKHGLVPIFRLDLVEE
ncbi:MAG: hypothetical protein ABS35_18915 [Kaistia sp. SCN 65-12]|nr:MAG: hypothetical protein ABS35_18915 [Kaistia sp. SCN 65-12]